MNCKSTVEMLSAYLDRELGAGERDAVRAHLADCGRCRTEERDLRTLKGLLLGVRAPEPAEDFERRLMRRLHEEAARPVRTPVLPHLGAVVWGQWGGLAAAFALGAVVLLRAPHAERAPVAFVRESPRTTVAQNVDFDVYAQHSEAYEQAGDPSVGAPILMPNADGP